MHLDHCGFDVTFCHNRLLGAHCITTFSLLLSAGIQDQITANSAKNGECYSSLFLIGSVQMYSHQVQTKLK